MGMVSEREYHSIMNIIGFYRKYRVRIHGDGIKIYEKRWRKDDISFTNNYNEVLEDIVEYVMKNNEYLIIPNLEISLKNLRVLLKQLTDFEEVQEIRGEDVGIKSVKDIEEILQDVFMETEEFEGEEIERVGGKSVDPYLSLAIQTFTIGFGGYIRRKDMKSLLKKFSSFKIKDFESDLESLQLEEIYNRVKGIIKSFLLELVEEYYKRRNLKPL